MNTKFAIRCAVFIAGVIINSFGIAFVTQAHLGTSPISGVPYVLSLRFTPTFGMFTYALNILFVIIQVALLRKDFKKVQFLQLAATLLFSAAIDVSMMLLADFRPDAYIAKIASLLLGCAILGFGIVLEVFAKVLLVPGEGVVAAMSRVSGKELGTVKVCFDVTLMITATILSMIFFHGLNGIREGTLISAVAVGMFVKLFNRTLKPFERWLDR